MLSFFSCLSLPFGYRVITLLFSKCKYKVCRSKKQQNLSSADTSAAVSSLSSFAIFLDFAGAAGFTDSISILSKNSVRNHIDLYNLD